LKGVKEDQFFLAGTDCVVKPQYKYWLHSHLVGGSAEWSYWADSFVIWIVSVTS